MLHRLALSFFVLALIAAPAAAQDDNCPQKDVIFVPTPQEVVDEMLKVANVTSRDVVYDLGSGDGRIPITAAKTYGAKAVGIDICEIRIKEANANLKAAGVGDKVKFLQQDLFKSDISEATVVTMYLLPTLNLRLIPKLNKELKPGTRVVSHQWEMKDPTDHYEYLPEQKLVVGNSFIYVWTIPIVRKPS